MGTVTDIDGNVYKTIKIDNQWWMAENLKVTHYRNGEPIPNVTDATEWSNLTTGAYCNYENNASIVYTYGRLYNWYALNDSRNIAPEGWYVPSDDEWKELEMYLGMSQRQAYFSTYRGTDEGGKLKETGTSHWIPPNTGATNESGFSALPGGIRSYNGNYYRMGEIASFWTSTEFDRMSIGAWFRYLSYDRSEILRYSDYKRYGFSVRLVKIMLRIIEIVPSYANLDNNDTQQFTCTALYSDGSTQDVTSTAGWSISSGLAGSIDNNGLFTAHATDSGSATITATYQGQTDQAIVTVSVSAGLETGSVTDIDGNVYQTVKIGGQWWMAENLKVTRYRNGDAIPNVTDDAEWGALSSGALCAHDNNEDNVDTYGYLYNWHAVNDTRNIAPAGWHVPTDEEWKQLEIYLGMNRSEADDIQWRGTDEGGKLKETGTTHWNYSDTSVTNESGFTALPGGHREPYSTFLYMGSYAYFWSSTESSNIYAQDYAYYRCLNSNNSTIKRQVYYKDSGFSIRLIRDN